MRILALPILFAGGCAVAPPAESPANGTAPAETNIPIREGEDRSGCEAARAAGLVGRKRSEALGAEAMRLSGARALRWIPEGAMVTMDYREDRLNIELDGAGTVTKIRCG